MNNDFQQTEDGIEILVSSSAIHADVIVPIRNAHFDWTTCLPEGSFQADLSAAQWLAIGWGDRGFYLETPTWSDLTVSNFLKALLWPTRSCVHVSAIGKLPRQGLQSVKISVAQYKQLVTYLRSSFKKSVVAHNATSVGDVIPIPNQAYGSSDAFFDGVGSYNCFNTCNSWANRALKSAEIRAPLFAPMPKCLMLYLPDSMSESQNAVPSKNETSENRQR